MLRLTKTLLGTILLFITLSAATHAASVSWDGGGADNDWCSDDNWSNNLEPTSSDDVTIDSSVTVTTDGCVSEANQLNWNTLTVGGTNTPTLQINQAINSGGALTIKANATVEQHYFGTLTLGGDLTIETDGLLTHEQTGTGAGTYEKVDIDLGSNDLLMQTNALINVDGKGYLGAWQGGNNSNSGRTAGNVTTDGSAGYSGGSHGGIGGLYYTRSNNIADSYDDIKDPSLPGGGGGGVDTAPGSNGGGVVRIQASNASVQGIISANGNIDGSRGTGAGGTINISVTTISGNGSIQATGGSLDNKGCGGGGRISITTTSQNFTGDILAHGGSETTNDKWRDGSAGSIYTNVFGTEKVLFDNNSLTHTKYASQIDSTNDATFGEVEVRNSARLLITEDATSFSANTVEVQTDSVFQSNLDLSFTDLSTTSLYINGGHAVFDGDLTLGSFSTSGLVTGTLETNGHTFITSGNVLIGNGLTWRANTNGTQLNQNLSGGESSFNVDSTFGFPKSGSFDIFIGEDTVTCTGKTPTSFTGCSGVEAHDQHEQIREDQTIFKSPGVNPDNFTNLDNFTIASGGVLTHTGDTINEVFSVEFTLTKALNVNNGGTIDVVGKGYLGGETTSELRWEDGVRGTENNGSEAARGVGNITSTGASRYYGGGSHGGRGGGSSGIGIAYGSIKNPSLPGGGGGDTWTSVPGNSGGGVIRINAEDIFVNTGGTINANGEEDEHYAEGAGGSIYLNATDEIGGSGAITANGGTPKGGGGRIALIYSTLSHSGTLSSYGGYSSNRDNAGAPGSIYKFDTDTDTYGHLEVNNNSVDHKLYSVIDEDSTGTFDSVTLSNNAKLRVFPEATNFNTTKLSVPTDTYFESDVNMTFDDINSSNLDLSGGTAQFDGNLSLSSFDTSTGATGTLITHGQTYVFDGDVTIGNGFNWQANVAATHLTNDIIVSAATIPVNSTYGFEDVVNTIYIDGDTIVCTGTTNTSFTGCAGVDEPHNNDDLVKEGQSIWQNVSDHLNNITIQNGGLLSHQGATQTFYGILDFEVDTKMTIELGGEVNLTGLGYLGGDQYRRYYNNGTYDREDNDGENADTEGFNTGATRYWAGGSHGGMGGDETEVADSYGSIINPTLPGGGGGGEVNDRGGNGGGVFRFRGPEIEINGNIYTDGGAEGSHSAGAGGSVYIEAFNAITGNGNITANGAANGGYGAGGGGRIALIYSDLSTNIDIQANGGDSTGNNRDGSSGTIYTKDTDVDANGHLLLDNNGSFDTWWYGFMDETNDAPFDTVTAQNGGQIYVKSTATEFDADKIEIKPDSLIESDVDHTFAAIDSSNLNINGGYGIFGGTLTLGTFDTTTMSGTLTTEGTDTLYVSSGNIIVGPNFTWENKGKTMKDTSNNIDTLTIDGEVVFGDTTLTTTGDVIVNSTGNLTHTDYEAGTSYSPQVNITAGGNFTLNQNGTVNVDEKGYIGASNSGYAYWSDGRYHTNGGDGYDGYTDGNTITGGSYYYEGGSHGGRGGTYTTNVPADPYDSIRNPSQPGGGGGGAGSSANRGGNGGGIVRISATNISVEGDMTAQGGDGAMTTGAGGTIYLNASSILSGGGLITADGGDNANYGRGGGGRVALYYTTDSHSGLQTACGGLGDNRTETGAAGTVYKKPTSQTYGDLIVGNCGNESHYNATILDTVTTDDMEYNGGYTYETVTVDENTALNIPITIDAVSDGGPNDFRYFHCTDCPVDNDLISDGELIFDTEFFSDGENAGWDGTTDYTGVEPPQIIGTVPEFSREILLLLLLIGIYLVLKQKDKTNMEAVHPPRIDLK